MPDAPASPPPARPYDVDTVELLRRLHGSEAEVVARLARERDHLFLLQEALVEVERASTLHARLRVFVEAIRQIGFDRVVISLRDESLDPTLVVTAGLSAQQERTLRAVPSSGTDWRRRLPLMERFRVSESYYLDARDEWVAREFQGGVESALEQGDDPDWNPHDTLVVPLRGRTGSLLALLALDDPADRRRPTLTRVRTVELFGQQVAYAIEQASLVELAERRASRLQRLQEVGAMLTRSLDEGEIVREIARQVARVVQTDGIVIAHPDLEAGTTTTALRLVGGLERPRLASALEGGAIAEVARRGAPVRISEYDPEVSALAAADDVVGDGGPARSLLAVPMMVGIRLVGVIAVYAAAANVYREEDEELLLTIGAQAATALTNARLYAESQRERRQSEALAEVARAVGESLRLGEVLHLILRHAMALLQTEGACVSLRRDDYLHVVAAVGCAELLAGMHLPVNGSLSGRALLEGTYLVNNDATAEPLAYRPTQRVAHVQKDILVPLITARGAIGVLAVMNRDADFTDTDARVLQRLADHVAVAIVNARLYEEVAEATREWRVAFDAIASGMVVLDEEGRIVRCNARGLQLAGAAGAAGANTVVGRDFHEAIFHERHGVGEMCPVERALGEFVAGRASVRSAARGLMFDVLASPHPNGGAVVTFDDVTSHHALAERHRRVVETANDAIVITDTGRRVSFANPAARELLGAGADILGRPVSDFVPPEVYEQVHEREDRAFAGEPQRYEAVLLRLDGERRVVSVSTAPLREVGQITGVVASLRDITTERLARDAVTQSEARYRNLFETASDAIYTLDKRGSFTSANAATCRLTGQTRETLLGRSIVPFLDPEETTEVRRRFTQALAGDSRHYECHLVTGDGARRLMSVTNTPIRQGTDVVGVLGIARDVTAERERAAALDRSEARYTRLVESASDAIFTVDEECRFTSVNRALEISTGLARASLLGSHFTRIVDPLDHEAMWGLFVRAMHGERQRGDLRYRDASGATRSASIISTPILESGRVIGALGVVRDTSEERFLTEQLMQQEKLAAVGQLVSGVAHELNNPLAGVMAFSQLLLESEDIPDDTRASLETINQECRRAAKIVSNLLTFARQHAPERSITDLNKVVHDTLELRRHVMRVHEIELEVTLEEPLPLTWADPFQLQQVVLNLLGNAEHALDGWAGERRVRVATARHGDLLAVTVSDTGAGIAADRIARIFNPFYTTKAVGQGTGLGLSISDGIVREHGGHIRVESAPGKGATFTIELPLVTVPGTEPGPPPIPEER